MTRKILMLCATLSLAACGGDAPAPVAEQPEAPPAMTSNAAEWEEITPGLRMRSLAEGDGETARAGHIATVHYTGWLYDPNAADERGTQFDSSVERGQTFEFPLGAGRVIRGWDEGVAGMQVGDKRELLIAPELAYGNRQVGPLIPPNSTLLFEVELFGVTDPSAN